MLKKRAVEHQRNTSPAIYHMIYNKQQFTNYNISILHQESDWFQCGVAEAIHIMHTDAQLNRDRRSHVVPTIYWEIIT